MAQSAHEAILLTFLPFIFGWAAFFYLPKCANRLEWYLYDRYHLLGTFRGRTKIHNFAEADFPKNREARLFA